MARSSSTLRIILMVLAGLIGLTALVFGGVAVGGAIGLGGGEAKDPAKPAPRPATTTFDQGEWTIDTPKGWTARNITKDADARKAVRYEGPNGEYFIVAIDPLGSGYAYDALWTYEVNGKGFTVVAKQACIGSEGCSTNDGQFTGYVLWKTGTTPVKVGGHVWYFMFGNSKSTTIDASTFEQIAESVRAK